MLLLLLGILDLSISPLFPHLRRHLPSFSFSLNSPVLPPGPWSPSLTSFLFFSSVFTHPSRLPFPTAYPIISSTSIGFKVSKGPILVNPAIEPTVDLSVVNSNWVWSIQGLCSLMPCKQSRAFRPRTPYFRCRNHGVEKLCITWAFGGFGSNIGPSGKNDGRTTKSMAKVTKEYWNRLTGFIVQFCSIFSNWGG